VLGCKSLTGSANESADAAYTALSLSPGLSCSEPSKATPWQLQSTRSLAMHAALLFHNSTFDDAPGTISSESGELRLMALATSLCSLCALSLCLGVVGYLQWYRSRYCGGAICCGLHLNAPVAPTAAAAAAPPVSEQHATAEALEQSTIESVRALPTSSWDGAVQGEASCALCLESFETGAVVCRLRCAHAFHHDCIQRWLVEGQRYQKRRCPLCSSDPLGTAEAPVPTARLASEPVLDGDMPLAQPSG